MPQQCFQPLDFFFVAMYTLSVHGVFYRLEIKKSNHLMFANFALDLEKFTKYQKHMEVPMTNLAFSCSLVTNV